MPNPYITNVDPYGQQDLSGYAPTMQDIAQQKLMQQLALAQQNSQVQDAGQQHGGGGMSGLNPLAMAMMLRKKKPGLGETTDANGNVIKDPTYGTGADKYNNMTPDETSNMMAYGV
jgi:hypothetical protein